MRTPKDRLHRVLVIGANPAGLAATNKLGEMGIPVTLMDRDPDLNEKLASEQWRLSSGLTLNYAQRPGLLRILRNPRIRCLIPGEVVSLKHTPQGFCARYRTTATYVDPDRCILCGRCADVCPSVEPDGSRPIRFNGRQSLPGRPVIDKRRQPLCQESCPLGVNAQGYIALARAGLYDEALDLIRKDNILPGICGRICTHPCEEACRRGTLDEPVAIRDIKRFLADRQWTESAENPTSVVFRSEKVAVIGSGPAGLAAAADLARFGYPVTVFEKEEKTGGMLRYGIGPWRLPRDVLDREIHYIERLGVEFRTGCSIDLTDGIRELRKEFSSVILATGTWKDRRLGVPGEDLDGVQGCLSFLEKLYKGEVGSTEERIAVVGDGNAAFDVARACVRLGARVTVLSWFPEELIPADSAEVVAAREEGIGITDSLKVVEFIGRDGRLAALRCAATKPGEPDAGGIPWPVIIPGGPITELPFDRAIVAIGQKGDASLCRPKSGISFTPAGHIQVDAGCRTGVDGVFAAGDAATGPSSVVRAMASGRHAARAVHAALSGEALPDPITHRPFDRDFPEITTDLPSLARADMPERQPAARREGFTEVALGLSETQVSSEAGRCLQCGVCAECLQCAGVCVSPGTIRHDEMPAEGVEHAGVVIIADPDSAPSVKGEDVLRAYSTRSSKDDVYAMMLRGFAAAAEAMILLGGTSQRMKGHGLSFSPPGPQLSSELRIGVFVCRCNNSLGWIEKLDRYVEGLTNLKDVEHTEVTASACSPEGSASILRTIREKGLSRIVLASCVCCPLDFICSACTDQRSRLKDALFHGTGVSRAMAETCNVRGEVLRLLEEDPELACRRFTGLIERSIGRARKLKALPAPARPYNFTTAVIGDSEAAMKSALTLAETGMEVFLFGAPERPLSEPVDHPNIHSFNGSLVKGLRGTVGNFQVIADISGFQQVFQVGAVILGESSRKQIPYLPMEDLSHHKLQASMQRRGVTGIPFFSPGATSIPGLFLASPGGIRVSERIKGTAAAILAASVMPRSPRQNKGYTVVVDESHCRGCGRCVEVCPYQAVNYRKNDIGGWYAVVDEALCKGCGSCIAVCPTNAADSPYRDRRYLEQMIEEIMCR